MNVHQRIEILTRQIEDSISQYNLKPSSSYLHEFERYKVMGEIILEKYNDNKLEYLIEIELPRFVRNARQL